MTDYNKYSITSVVKDFDEEEMEGRQVRFSLNTEDDVFFLIDDDEIITDFNKTLTKYATTDEDGEAGVYVYIESSVESATVKASIDGLNEQIIIFNSGIRVSSVALQTDKNTIYNGNKNENATLTATVTASETYTGVVAFYDGNTLLGTASAVNNVATFTLEGTNHSMVTPTVTRNIRAVAGGMNSNVLEITDYYTYPDHILIRPYYNGWVVTQVPENETWRLQIGLRDNRHAAVPNATGTVSIDGVEQEITLGNDGFWNYNITNGSGTGSVSVNVSFGNLTDSMNVGIVLHDCTDIMFNQSSYTADSDGNVTLEVTLVNVDVPVPNATVTLTDGTSVYTGITNTNGIASVTVSVSSETTFTCTYNNVSDTTRVNYMAYQPVEYLQSNGSQYINTGYILKANDKVEVTVSMQGIGSYNGVFGARKNDYVYNAYALFGRFGSSNRFVYARTGDERKGNTISTNVIYDVTTNGATCTIKQNGSLVQTLTNTGTIEDCVNPCGLFVLNTFNGADGFNKDTFGYMKIYSFKITDSNDNVVMDLIPVRDGTTGYMYDKVTGDVLTNYGTFLYGEDI